MILADSKSRRGGMPPKQKTQVMPTLSAQAISRDGERMEHMIACYVVLQLSGVMLVNGWVRSLHIDVPFYIYKMWWAPSLGWIHVPACCPCARQR